MTIKLLAMFHFLSTYSFEIIFCIVLLELGFAVYTDLMTAKFPNKFALGFLALNIFLLVFLRGFSSLSVALITMGAAILMLAPIYMAKILGGGDIKLIFALSPLLLLDEFLGFLLMSFIWAGVFGLFKSLLGGNLRSLLVNTFFVGKRIKVPEDSIPFTVGILLGWCSYKSFMSLGVL